jgi:hypothetical protein
MKIDTKYEIGDIVYWLIGCGAIKRGVVKSINVYSDGTSSTGFTIYYTVGAKCIDDYNADIPECLLYSSDEDVKKMNIRISQYKGRS